MCSDMVKVCFFSRFLNISIKFYVRGVRDLVPFYFACGCLAFADRHVFEYPAAALNQEQSHEEEARAHNDSVQKTVKHQRFEAAREHDAKQSCHKVALCNFCFVL